MSLLSQKVFEMSTNSPEEPDDPKTAIENSEPPKKEKDDGMQRAVQIRIKQVTEAN